MLTGDELDAIRSEVADWLPDVVVVYSLTETDAGGGETTTAYSAIWSGQGRIAPLSSNSRIFADAVKAVATSVVTLPHDAGLTERSEVEIGGVRYRVVGVSADHSIQLHTRVAVVRVR